MSGTLKNLSVQRAQLDTTRQTFIYDGGELPAGEGVLHLLTGRVTVTVTGQLGETHRWTGLGGRRSVFDGPPTAVAFDRRATVRVDAETPADVFLAHAGAEGGPTATLIRPEDVLVHDIGEGYYRRMVREVVGERTGAALLRCGETVNPPGQWSSWPHHEFDAQPELFGQFEETFTTFTQPLVPGTDAGEVILRRRGKFVDGADVNDVLVMRNGQTAIVPLGYHPICAPLMGRLCYVWFYISPIPKRYAKTADDGGYYAS